MPVEFRPKDPNAPQDFWTYLTHRRGWGYPDVFELSSVVLNLIPILFMTTLWTTLLCLIYIVFGINISFSANLTGSIAVVVGLLLGFRTNNAYDRFNEGRKIFACMCTHIRNCTRAIWIGVEEHDENDRRNKEINIRLLLAYVVAVKHHIRYEFGTHWPDLEDLLSEAEGFQLTYYEGSATLTDTTGDGGDEKPFAIDIPRVDVTLRTLSSRVPPTVFANLRPTLKTMSEEEQKVVYGDCATDLEDVDASMSLPLEIIFHLNVYIEKICNESKLDMGKFGSITGNFDVLIDSLGNLERIGNTPIPTAYNVTLKQAVVLYVFALPFTVIGELGWFTIPTIFLIAFILFGILAVGSEIENPFGYDKNDLPLDDYCKDLEAEVRYLQRHLPTKKRKEISK
ncbi:Bestrophin, RFP-TM, chloride channel-domain-containing protein [Gigaspora rosea]|uniref:Bestrophin, RFP-TM, chloride channel-domain-containing protein n=1 Tax=Gigaspora rosea TaxID=44941 RepID=A0A397UDT5_9GLOM|nr:Bestrophin, RFP-TM, chloride channel-domain-containing protein [Gigaspora rosea]